jgi:hypothetical protein
MCRPLAAEIDHESDDALPSRDALNRAGALMSLPAAADVATDASVLLIREPRTTERVSVGPQRAQLTKNSDWPLISHVAYGALVREYNQDDLYVHDRVAGISQRVAPVDRFQGCPAKSFSVDRRLLAYRIIHVRMSGETEW